MQHRPPRGRDGRAGDEDLAVAARARPRAEQRRRRARRDLRARLGQAVRRRDRARRPRPRARAAPAAAARRRAAPSAGGRARSPASSRRGASSARARRSSRRRGPQRASTRSVSKRSWTIAVVAAMALRNRIESPPTCDSGSGTASAPRGRAERDADPSALHSQLPYVSSTGFGAPLEPDVWTTIATASRSCRARVATPAAVAGRPARRSTIARRARLEALLGGRSRRSIGTATAPSSRIACSATQNASPGGSSIPTRSPAPTPRAGELARRRAASPAAARTSGG